MNGIWLEQQQLQLRQDLPMPIPAPGEALVRVLRAGICNTDLELLRGYYPYTGVLGHEFVGIVVDGCERLLNQRVVGEINAYCGTCEYCQQGLSNHCARRTVLGIVNRHGAFAEYLTLPIVNLHPIPERVSTSAATFAEPIAAALEIQAQLAITPNHRVLVIGDGKLGQLVAQTLALTGCDLFVVGRHLDKLARLQSRQIDTGLATDMIPRSYHIAVDCTGNPAGFDLACKSLRPRGTLVMKSTYAGRLSIDASALVVDEITVIGSRCGPFDRAIELLATDRVDVMPLIAAEYPLQDGLQAFHHAQQTGGLKVLLTMNT
jgi:threonine dehydrogenase-like Zn-dependent dehydrogenase